jgi:hypothetical protein
MAAPPLSASQKSPSTEEVVDENKVNVVLKNGETVYLNFLRLKRLPPALWYSELLVSAN